MGLYYLLIVKQELLHVCVWSGLLRQRVFCRKRQTLAGSIKGHSGDIAENRCHIVFVQHHPPIRTLYCFLHSLVFTLDSATDAEETANPKVLG